MLPGKIFPYNRTVVLVTQAFPFSDYIAADRRYLAVHIDPHIVTCERWYVFSSTARADIDLSPPLDSYEEFHRQNLKEHQKICRA